MHKLLLFTPVWSKVHLTWDYESTVKQWLELHENMILAITNWVSSVSQQCKSTFCMQFAIPPLTTPLFPLLSSYKLLTHRKRGGGAWSPSRVELDLSLPFRVFPLLNSAHLIRYLVLADRGMGDRRDHFSPFGALSFYELGRAESLSNRI